MIRWIFFDVGSTLVDEQAAYDHRAREMLQGTAIRFEDFDAKRKELAAQGLDGNSAAIRFFGLTKTPWHSEDEVPYKDALQTLAALRQRSYHLGIVANQAAGTEQRLEKWGLLQYFDVVAASAELGVQKPDPAIFQKALKMAGCAAENAVMVGDRLDNDIFPAKELGMQTVWIRNGLAKYQSEKLAQGKADHLIEKLCQLCDVFPGYM